MKQKLLSPFQKHLEHAYTIMKLTKQEKNEYLYLVDIYFNGEK